MKRVFCVLAICLVPSRAVAQTADLPIPPAAKAVLDVFSKPLHPILGSVAPGGGVAVGLGYDTPRTQEWFHNASAKVSINRYWAVQAETGYQTATSRLGVFGSVRKMTSVDFFGIGPRSQFATRSTFELREAEFGARGSVRVHPAVKLGGSAEVFNPSLSLDSDELISLEKIFPASDVPGFGADPRFMRYRGYIELSRTGTINPAVKGAAVPGGHQGTYQLAMEETRDQEGGTYSFHRVELEGRQQFAGLRAGHRLTLHGFLGLTDQDAQVPYYLEYTLGGSSLSANRPDLIGGDGTKATLRGYRNYRFRDRDVILAQAEYRIPLRHGVETTVFYDAGQVAGRPSLLFQDWRHGAGLSLSYMHDGVSLTRIDVAYAGEGVRVLWGFGLSL